MSRIAPGEIAPEAGGETHPPILARGKRELDPDAEERPRKRFSLAELLVFVVIVLILGGLVVPPMHTGGREPARRACCRSNVRQIALACMLYAEDNAGAFPQRLAQLYPAYVDDARLFSCPTSPSTYADFKSGRVTPASSSYALVPGLTDDMPGGLVLIHENSIANHGGDGGNVGFVDGHVEWRGKGDFGRLMKAHAAALNKWRAAGAKPKDPSGFLKP